MHPSEEHSDDALDVGFVAEVVAPAERLPRPNRWPRSGFEMAGRARFADASAHELKRINARESDLADAFLAAPFLMGPCRFLWSRRKYAPALMFLALRASRPAWSRLL